ncbi:trypsin-like peptidase domain-containing protein [Inhella sp.]|uniref:trypsin-like peptidase domain-containing protein n=1 Tax=Inhella sp. TaxID=1921806 RepID=UPI0035B233F3
MRFSLAQPQRRALLALALLAPCALPAASLPELVQAAKPAVVLVGTHAETDSPRFQFRGSGFVIGDGLSVVTAAHVLPDALLPSERSPAANAAAAGVVRQLVVQVWRGGSRWEQRTASVQSVSRATDLALLRLEGNPVPTLALAPPEPTPQEGIDVALIGFPIGGLLGFSHVTHRGVLSAVTQFVPPQNSARQLTAAAIRQLREAGTTLYQLDAVAYPGNSGGPVFAIDSGQVIGVLSMSLARSGREGALSAPSGISYAIPVAALHELLKR